MLDENQITELLNEHNDTVDKDYEQSEVIINDVELLEMHNESDNSIFTGKFLLKLKYCNLSLLYYILLKL